MSGLKSRVAKGAIWATMEKFVVQAVSFVVGMVLARLLTPNDYGTVALLSIFFAIAGSLASCGFGNALVQKKEVGELEFNSVFYVSIVVSLVIYGVFFFTAPWIADFYRTPILKPVVRVSALSFVFHSINSVQGAELSRKMLFDRRFKISLITCAVSSVCGISFALLGWGVWAIVLSSTITSIASVIAYWCIIAWRPRWMFRFNVLKGLFSYGWKLSVAGLVHTTYSNLYGFLIGRFYNPADLAFVNKGNSVPNLLMSSIDGTINSVSFPALAQLQDDKDKLREAMRRMIQSSTFLVFPLMAGLALCARSLILLLYGRQWVEAVPYVQIACISFALFPFNSINTNAISAMGRSDVFLLLDCIKKTVGIGLTFIALRYSVMVFMLVIALVQSPFAVIVNSVANGKLLGYKPWMQFRDVFPAAFLTLVMSIAIYIVQMVIGPMCFHIQGQYLAMLLSIVISFLVGVVVYFGLAIYFKPQAFREYLFVLHPMLNSRLPRIARFVERFLK